MKRMIITPAQLKAINEAAMNYGGMVNGNMTSPGQIANKANDFFAQNPTANSVMFKNTSQTANKPAQMVNQDDQTVQPGFSDASSYVVDKQNESRKYSKRQVELGRMLEMRKRGKVYSKKQLNEMFLGSDEAELRERIGKYPASAVFDFVGEVFGSQEEENLKNCFMTGKDPTDYVIELYRNADPDTQEEFFDNF